MKVAIITRDYPPSIGGVATHASSLVKELRRVGVEVGVFVGGTDQDTLLLPLRSSLSDYDIIHVQSAPYGALVSSVPLIATVHSPIPIEFAGYRLASKLKAVPSMALEAISLNKAKSILAVSEATRNDTARVYRIPLASITIIGNGVSQAYFARSGRDRNPRTILIVSRLEPRKNVREAVATMCGLPVGSYEAKVVGVGSQFRELKAMAEAEGAKIEFLGKVENEVLPSFYLSAGIFLSTSLSEGFGLALLEAMASGCAVVASDIGAHRSLITHGENGMLYPDATTLRKTLSQLLSSPALVEELGKNARESAKNYTWEAVGRRVLAAYKRVA